MLLSGVNCLYLYVVEQCKYCSHLYIVEWCKLLMYVVERCKLLICKCCRMT